jgi:DNA-binding beta-propeller fold protein YncE
MLAGLNALGTAQARPGAPADVVYAPVGHYPQALALYGRAHTLYAANNGDNDISVLDTSRCNAAHLTGCARASRTQDVGVIPTGLAVDPRTQTVYVANSTQAKRGTSVSVVSTARCSAVATRGCTKFPHLPPVIPLPFNPADVAVDQLTDTVYIDDGGDDLAIVDGRTCNGHTTRGCRHPVITSVPSGSGGIALNPRTSTIYTDDYFASVATVIDARQCNVRTTRGCRHPQATFRVGRHPWRMHVDAGTDTLYVPNLGAGTVSVIDAARCRASVTRGCRARPPVVHVGREPEGVAVDRRNHLAFVANSGSDTVSVFDASRCRGAVRTGCGARVATWKVGSLPDGIVVDASSATVYVSNNAGDTVAVFPARWP